MNKTAMLVQHVKYFPVFFMPLEEPRSGSYRESALSKERCQTLGTAHGKLATKLPDESQLEAASRDLGKIVLPILQRLTVVEGAPATLDLVRWACQFYSYSVLAHFREMLRSFLVLTWNGLIPASFVTARCLFEIAAHAHYAHKHVTQYLDSNDLESAQRFLTDINMGSRYMQEEYGEKTEEWPPFAAPREIAKVIRTFDEWTKRKARTEYSFLSEFAHPNMAAFSHYYKIELGEAGFGVVTFFEPRRDPDAAPWPQVSISFIASLHFVCRLLRRVDEKEVAPHVETVLGKFAK